MRGSCSDDFSDESDSVQIEGSLNFGSEQLKNMESIPKLIYEKYLANIFSIFQPIDCPDGLLQKFELEEKSNYENHATYHFK